MDLAGEVLEVSAACDVMGRKVADVIGRHCPGLDLEAIASAASVEIFAAFQDVTLLARVEAEQLAAARRAAWGLL